MLYQLSYALKPHYQVSTSERVNISFNQHWRKLLPLMPSSRSDEKDCRPNYALETPTQISERVTAMKYFLSIELSKVPFREKRLTSDLLDLHAENPRPY